jgi:hypothetical protein
MSYLSGVDAGDIDWEATAASMVAEALEDAYSTDRRPIDTLYGHFAQVAVEALIANPATLRGLLAAPHGD